MNIQVTIKGKRLGVHAGEVVEYDISFTALTTEKEVDEVEAKLFEILMEDDSD